MRRSHLIGRSGSWRERRGALILSGLGVLSLIPGVTGASQYTGTILDIRIAPSPSAPTANVRVSILTSGPTSCTGSGGNWYSFDLPDGPTSKLWGATLLAALHDGRNVGIFGTGVCDSYGLEEVLYIDGL
jgi:hypothetical protein